MQFRQTIAGVALPVMLSFALGACAVGEGGAPAPAAAPLAQGAAPWRNLDERTRKPETLAELEQLARDFPWARTVGVSLVNRYLEADRKAEALAEIVRLTGAGYAFSDNGERALLAMFEGAERERLAAAFAADLPPLEASSVAAEVPADIQLVESVALDRETGRLFARSIVSQGLFVRSAGETGWERVPLANAGSIGGMVLDEAARTLWVASGIYDETPRPEGAFSGLIGVALDGGPEGRIAGPPGSTPSDILLASDGTLYAADPLRGAIYRAAPGDASLSVVVGPGTFRSPQGMIDLGGKLLVSDWGYGLALVDLSSGKVLRVDPETPILLDGIDGMWRYGEEIVAVQNGARPAQIVAFRLADSGVIVRDWRIIERGVPAWTEPASGTLAGDALLYVGNGQWDRHGKGGALREGRQAEPTRLHRLDLSREAPKVAKKRQ